MDFKVKNPDLVHQTFTHSSKTACILVETKVHSLCKSHLGMLNIGSELGNGDVTNNTCPAPSR